MSFWTFYQCGVLHSTSLTQPVWFAHNFRRLWYLEMLRKIVKVQNNNRPSACKNYLSFACTKKINWIFTSSSHVSEILISSYKPLIVETISNFQKIAMLVWFNLFDLKQIVNCTKINTNFRKHHKNMFLDFVWFDHKCSRFTIPCMKWIKYVFSKQIPSSIYSHIKYPVFLFSRIKTCFETSEGRILSNFFKACWFRHGSFRFLYPTAPS